MITLFDRKFPSENNLFNIRDLSDVLCVEDYVMRGKTAAFVHSNGSDFVWFAREVLDSAPTADFKFTLASTIDILKTPEALCDIKVLADNQYIKVVNPLYDCKEIDGVIPFKAGYFVIMTINAFNSLRTPKWNVITEFTTHTTERSYDFFNIGHEKRFPAAFTDNGDMSYTFRWCYSGEPLDNTETSRRTLALQCLAETAFYDVKAGFITLLNYDNCVISKDTLHSTVERLSRGYFISPVFHFLN